MNPYLKQSRKFALFIALFALTPLWNTPHTIAARYACEALLLIIIFSYKLDWKSFFQRNKIVLVFFAYLIFQLIFFSSDHKAAMSNFKSEWMHFILFSIAGAGVGLILGQKIRLSFLLYLGIAFSIPLYVHLTLSLLKGVSTGTVPWGYWGINEIHGDLAYTSLQSSILLLTYFLFEKRSFLKKIISGILLLPCILSVLIASSRGGIIFFIIAIITVIFIYFFLSEGKGISSRIKIILFSSLLLIGLSIYLISINIDPNRWGGIQSRVLLGLQGNPTEIYCNGITSLEKDLQSKGIEITPEIQVGLNSIVDGDGARVMAARSGAWLITSFPMGINQSKQAYQQAISQHCNKVPAIFISHTHNAWIDTALAIGIPGALLLLLVFFNYGYIGYQTLKLGATVAPFGMALLASAALWFLRGILDSTLRDQMLEMQAFVFALLLAIIVSQTSANKRVAGTI